MMRYTLRRVSTSPNRNYFSIEISSPPLIVRSGHPTATTERYPVLIPLVGGGRGVGDGAGAFRPPVSHVEPGVLPAVQSRQNSTMTVGVSLLHDVVVEMRDNRRQAF